MKLKNLFLVVAVAMVFAVCFTACSQSSNKASVDETEMTVDKGDEAEKCGGEESKCGEGKCGEGTESDTTKKCGEGKCGEGKCGEGEGEGEGSEEEKCGAE